MKVYIQTRRGCQEVSRALEAKVQTHHPGGGWEDTVEDGQEFGRAGRGLSLTFWADVLQSRGAGEARVGHQGGSDGRCPGNKSPIGLDSGAP